MQAAEESGEFMYVPPSSEDDDKQGVMLDRSVSGDSELRGPASPSTAPDSDHVNRRMVRVSPFVVVIVVAAAVGTLLKKLLLPTPAV